MTRRFVRTITYLIVAAQLLLSAPVVTAATFELGSGASRCADSMATPAAKDPCPCCPEKGMSTAACLLTCTASVAAIPAFELPRAVEVATLVSDSPSIPTALESEPPLKPPPIY